MKISIIGSGSWGTALANVAADNFHDVLIYGREQDIVNEINNNHTNNYYLPNALINTKVVATTNLKSAVEDKDIIVLAVPSGAIESVCKLIDPLINKKSIIVNVAKGFNSNNERLSNTIRGSISCEKREEIVSLIGPSHAEEVIQRLYTAISAVSIDVKVAKIVQKAFSNDYLRVYTLHDEIGAEYACACKNVIAIASGIISGLGFGDNTLAALITRGLAEISRLGIIMGGE
ncbi:MAG: NAD(P)H-dependent glycerol-3-phosphate dehydrogenase, partial [Bacilli bacterium]|nr:NAD(P)H-dependent glycerol-3-phosphate dehydrogenase [Bacilli bacterium]